jgi:hypothetical protein
MAAGSTRISGRTWRRVGGLAAELEHQRQASQALQDAAQQSHGAAIDTANSLTP